MVTRYRLSKGSRKGLRCIYETIRFSTSKYVSKFRAAHAYQYDFQVTGGGGGGGGEGVL